MDPIVSLASTVHANKGVYAVLLGSGVSTSADILTGWGIVLDLIRRVAQVEGKSNECSANPEAWYRERFGRDASYSALLEELAGTQAERQQLLRGYFIPTPEEREEGKKQPTDAHKALAELVASGHIRVILTTNFDPLMEQALEAEGIVPTVLSTPEAIQGSVPLAHSQSVVVKLHGDYRDPRILNTVGELTTYAAPIDRLLDQVLDEYGLIVSGWSTESDVALRAAIERAPNRRYSTFWAYRSSIREEAREVVHLRSATVIPGVDADTLFRRLAEGVKSLEELKAPQPLSARIAAQTVKRYLNDAWHQIRLHDLLLEEAERIRRFILTNPELSLGGDFSGELLDRRLTLLETASSTLMSMYSIAGYWCEEDKFDLWWRTLERLVDFSPPIGNYYRQYQSLQRYPALLTNYAAGVAAIANGREQLLAPLLTRVMVSDPYGVEVGPLVVAASTSGVLRQDDQQRLPGMENRHLPLSDRLSSSKVLRSAVANATLDNDERRFEAAFDRFEYLAGLLGVHHRGWAPLGSFAWRRWEPRDNAINIAVGQEIEQQTTEWPLLKAGAFNGSLERLMEVKAGYDSLRPGHWF